MDDDQLELVPTFVAEVEARLRRFSDLLPALEIDAGAGDEAKRELHTLKGAGRMMGLAEFAEICHAAEEVLLAPGADALGALAAAHDALARAAESVGSGQPIERDPELFERLAAAVATEGAAAPGAPRPAGDPEGGAAGRPVIEGGERFDLPLLDAFAERAVRVRAAAAATGRLSERIRELARRAEDGLRDPQPGQVLAVLGASLREAAVAAGALETRLARAAEEQIDTVLGLRLAPVAPLFRALAREARELARRRGREVTVEIAGQETRLDRAIAREVEGALRHLVTNAVDHGLEPAGERLAAGKPPSGLLRLEARSGGRGVEIVVADDGRGLDPGSLAARAVAAGRRSAAEVEALDETARLRLALLPGLSTRADADEISGRGLGLDAVDAAAARVDGALAIASSPGRGATFVLDLPAARRGERVLLARLGGARLALPAAAVRRVLRFDARAIEVAAGRRALRAGDRRLPLVDPARALGLEESGETPLALEVEAGGRTALLAVARVDGEEEVLVRPLPRRFPVSALVDGAALLASGEPVVVLAPRALAALDDESAGGAAGRAGRSTRLLLVDDSPVTRELERRLLEDAGFLVDLASDGDEALERLAESSYDLLVTDIEMPGLDGIALTERLRASARFARFPIVVVSTRDRPADRLRGLRAGADAYLGKQDLSASELVSTVRRLTGG